MSVAIVIPARYASTRYPGKPLVPLTGATGIKKTLIERSWHAAMAVSGVDRVVVATDDSRIREAAESFGAEVVMTSPDCANGTERCADALQEMDQSYEIVVNLQGDAPLTPHWFVEDLIVGLRGDPSCMVATPVLKTDATSLNSFKQDRSVGRVGGTTAVFDQLRHALYFSKEVIPFTASNYQPGDQTPVYHHVGVYAYRQQVLAEYPKWKTGPLEENEGLEQLRFLENGMPILCVEVDAKDRVFWELNNPEDVPRLETMMRDMGEE